MTGQEATDAALAPLSPWLAVLFLLVSAVLIAIAVALVWWPARTPSGASRPDSEAVAYLTDADREWLTEHGWSAPTAAAGVGVNGFVRELQIEVRRLQHEEAAARVSELRARVQAQTSRHYAVRFETCVGYGKGSRKPFLP